MAACLVWLALGVAGAVQLDLDCAAPDRARALIEYARLSEIEQVEEDGVRKHLARQGGLARPSWAEQKEAPLLRQAQRPGEHTAIIEHKMAE